jgi:hypothetical protein
MPTRCGRSFTTSDCGLRASLIISSPQLLEFGATAIPRHQIDAKPGHVGPSAAKVCGMTFREALRIERGNSNCLRFELRQSSAQTPEILGIGENQKVKVAAEFRRAVKHAL